MSDAVAIALITAIAGNVTAIVLALVQVRRARTDVQTLTTAVKVEAVSTRNTVQSCCRHPDDVRYRERPPAEDHPR